MISQGRITLDSRVLKPSAIQCDQLRALCEIAVHSGQWCVGRGLRQQLVEASANQTVWNIRASALATPFGVTECHQHPGLDLVTQ